MVIFQCISYMLESYTKNCKSATFYGQIWHSTRCHHLPHSMVFNENAAECECQWPQCLFPDSWFQLTLPQCDGNPSHRCQLLPHFLVPFSVAFNFLLPEFGIRLWYNIEPAAFMPVPETSVHKNACPVWVEYYIRLTRQSRMIQPVPESVWPVSTCKRNFWERICEIKVYIKYKSLHLGGLPAKQVQKWRI